MSLNSAPSSERLHISFFGLRNVGKSSLVNAVTAQNLSVVSEIKGTTTDPVKKAMELLPIGPVVITDTAGLDDEGILGELRIEKTKEILNKTDIAILVANAKIGLSQKDKDLISVFKQKNLLYIIAYNKADLLKEIPKSTDNEIYVSAINNINIHELKELIGKIAAGNIKEKYIIADKLKPEDSVILVTPIDSAAPKGRLILPQQQVLRELLDFHAITTVVQENELKKALEVNTPKLVITDSQAFKRVSSDTPDDILLTSFSILFARYKGVLKYAVKGVNALSKLQNGDFIPISEGCTHHRQCEDIG
ncbi:[bacterium]|nr:[FeFe] hydrogenase H-cluster maturation GTPase HydF [bacterium]